MFNDNVIDDSGTDDDVNYDDVFDNEGYIERTSIADPVAQSQGIQSMNDDMCYTLKPPATAIINIKVIPFQTTTCLSQPYYFIGLETNPCLQNQNDGCRLNGSTQYIGSN